MDDHGRPFVGHPEEERLTRPWKEFERNSLGVIRAVMDLPTRIAFYCGRAPFLQTIVTGSFDAVDQRCAVDGGFAHATARLRDTITALQTSVKVKQFRSLLNDAERETERFGEHPYGFFITTFCCAIDAAAAWQRMPADACSLVLRQKDLGDRNSFRHWFVRALHDTGEQEDQLRIAPAQACLSVADAADDEGDVDETFLARVRTLIGRRLLLALTMIGEPSRRELQECRMVVQCDDPALRFVIRPEPHRCPSLPISLRNHEKLEGRLPLETVILGPRATSVFEAEVRRVLARDYEKVEVHRSEHSLG